MEFGAFAAGFIVGAVVMFFIMRKHGSKLTVDQKAGGGFGEER